MSIESAILGFIFDIDNWAKDSLVNNMNYPAVKIETDLVYDESNPVVCTMDLLWNPDSKKYDKYPVVLNVHGGGWIIGDKMNSTGMCKQFADGGCFVVNINYGMPEKANPFFEKNDPKKSHGKEYLWPVQAHHIYAAMKWIAANADKYNLDLKNVFISGDSAGSHLAAVGATFNSNPEYAKILGLPEEMPFKLKGSLQFCGFYNLDTFWGFDMKKIPIARTMLRDLMGRKDPENDPSYKFTNPIPFVTEKYPRAMIISGKNDVMTHGQSDLFQMRLADLGKNYVRYNSEALLSLHDYQILSFLKCARDCMAAASAFIDETVQKF